MKKNAKLNIKNNNSNKINEQSYCIYNNNIINNSNIFDCNLLGNCNDKNIFINIMNNNINNKNNVFYNYSTFTNFINFNCNHISNENLNITNLKNFNLKIQIIYFQKIILII